MWRKVRKRGLGDVPGPGDHHVDRRLKPLEGYSRGDRLGQALHSHAPSPALLVKSRRPLSDPRSPQRGQRAELLRLAIRSGDPKELSSHKLRVVGGDHRG